MSDGPPPSAGADDVQAAYPAPLRGDSLAELEEQLPSAQERLTAALQRRGRQSVLLREARTQVSDLTHRARAADGTDAEAAARLRELRKRKRVALREAELAFERHNGDCSRLHQRVKEVEAGIVRLRKHRAKKRRTRQRWFRFDLQEQTLAAKQKRRPSYVLLPLAVLGLVVCALVGVRVYASRTAGHIPGAADGPDVGGLQDSPGAATALQALGLAGREAPPPVRPTPPATLTSQHPGPFSRVSSLVASWLRPPAAFTAPAFLAAMASADLLGDAAPELAFLDVEGQRILVYHFADSQLRFATAVETGPWPNDLAAGDVNGDGAQDLVVVHGDGAVMLLLNRGAGEFERRDLGRGGAGADVDLVDLNGDGTLDVVATGWKATQTYDGHGDGSFLGPLLVHARAEQQALVVADFTGDGILDVATLERFDREPRPRRTELCVTPLTGELLAAADPVRHRFAPPLHTIAAVDVDGDGRAELVALQLRGAGPGGYATYAVLLLDGVTSSAMTRTELGQIQSGAALAVADLNGDGRDDVLAGLDVFFSTGRTLAQQPSRIGVGYASAYWQTRRPPANAPALIAHFPGGTRLLVYPATAARSG